MARRVYFAFHYQKDIMRVNVVRNSPMTKASQDAAGFIDSSLWEKVQKDGPLAIKRMINNGLTRTTVTAVLLGSETAERKWVQYELVKSLERGNGIVAIRIHNVRIPVRPVLNPYLPYSLPSTGATCPSGPNILDHYSALFNSSASAYAHHRRLKLSQVFKTYDWVANNGYQNFGKWVEEARTLSELYLAATPLVQDRFGLTPSFM